MREAKKNFIKIMRIELKDLHMDIEALIRECQKEKEKGKLTNHVFMQNLVVFKNELLGLNTFDEILDSTNPEEYDTLDDMINYLKNRFRKMIKASGLVEAINIYVERKLTKVANYITKS